ncbi:Transcriptional regulatory protein ZraR [Rubripirellula obstinata]|uniref:Transcriptional regulatory protein ZraR n=1 Tax=Rubripirellula obstinata TaxID=406547 RepID=A0A5B1CLQ4_9BACT|nr:helix-turn-helix domain-containing protein [Rubripirellula obstinata]KAA1260719.1 Transcriptional regulatory protein ZraR [Rubripirellula obstinata]
MSGTKIRPLSRLLDSSDARFWVIGPDGTLVYLSGGIQDWLDVSPEQLLGRRCVAGSPVSDDPLDQIAAMLSPPPGLEKRGTASLRIGALQGSSVTKSVATTEARFFCVGDNDDALIFGVAGAFDDRAVDVEVQDAVAIRQRIDNWRKMSSKQASIVTAGDSTIARRLRHRLHVASLARTDVLLVGPRGCGSERIAKGMIDESSIVVDGPLMDSELLDATLSPLTNSLTSSTSSSLADSAEIFGSAIIRDLEQMPVDAQVRLAYWHQQFSGRLRLIGLSQTADGQDLNGSQDRDSDPGKLNWAETQAHGLSEPLIDLFCACVIPIGSLSDRVEDLSVMASALLDRRRAAGETKADRFNRAALDAMVIYPWPGQFDELDHSIRHAARSATSDAIGPADLPLAIRSYRPGDPLLIAKHAAVDLDKAVASFEQRLIDQTLDSTGGNRAEAARRLGISRARLLRKIGETP